MIICFDIDGTLCTDTGGRYLIASPIPEAVQAVQDLFSAGHRIILYTARGSETGIDWKDATEKQLRAWGVPYHELLMGKPAADWYVDDKALSARDWTTRRFQLPLNSSSHGE